MRQREKVREAARYWAYSFSTSQYTPLNYARRLHQSALERLTAARFEGDVKAASKLMNRRKVTKAILRRAVMRTRETLDEAAMES